MSADSPASDRTGIPGANSSVTRVRASSWARNGSWLLVPAAGAVLVWLIQLAGGWIATLSWFPFQGVFELADYFEQPWGTLLAVTIGAIIGLGFASLWEQERMSVAVAAREVTICQGRRARRFDRADISAVFLDGTELVLLSTADTELARERTGLDPGALRSAFRGHQYSWSADDPYAGHYQKWAADSPELSLRVNSLLAERHRALNRSRRAEQDSLRADLARHGVLVRDHDGAQHWRFSEGV